MSDQIRDSLDEAIDRVASRLVSVKEDPDAARRIVAVLPAQPGREWWSGSFPLQAAAMAVIILLLIVYVRPFDVGEPAPVDERRVEIPVREQPAGSPEPVMEVEQTRPQAVAGSAARRVARRPVDLQPAFGLAAIEALEQLSVSTLVATAPLSALELAAVEPISISDLPLGGDAPPPFSKE